MGGRGPRAAEHGVGSPANPRYYAFSCIRAGFWTPPGLPETTLVPNKPEERGKTAAFSPHHPRPWETGPFEARFRLDAVLSFFGAVCGSKRRLVALTEHLPTKSRTPVFEDAAANVGGVASQRGVLAPQRRRRRHRFASPRRPRPRPTPPRH